MGNIVFTTKQLGWLSKWASQNLNEYQIVALGLALDGEGDINYNRKYFTQSTLMKALAHTKFLELEAQKPHNLPN